MMSSVGGTRQVSHPNPIPSSKPGTEILLAMFLCFGKRMPSGCCCPRTQTRWSRDFMAANDIREFGRHPPGESCRSRISYTRTRWFWETRDGGKQHVFHLRARHLRLDRREVGCDFFSFLFERRELESSGSRTSRFRSCQQIRLRDFCEPARERSRVLKLVEMPIRLEQRLDQYVFGIRRGFRKREVSDISSRLCAG